MIRKSPEKKSDFSITSIEEYFFKRLRQKTIFEIRILGPKRLKNFKARDFPKKKQMTKFKKTDFTTYFNLYRNTILNILDLEQW